MKDCILNSIKKVGSDQEYNRINFDKYSALGMTKKITDFFDRVMVDN
jgi:hypothetical protein